MSIIGDADLAERFGSEAAVVLRIAEDAELARPLIDGLPYLRAEVVFAARYEMAQTWTTYSAAARALACWLAKRVSPRPTTSRRCWAMNSDCRQPLGDSKWTRTAHESPTLSRVAHRRRRGKPWPTM